MFAKIKNGQVVQYPYGWSEFVADNNNTNYGSNYDILALFPTTNVAQEGFECVEVSVPTPPQIDSKTQRLEQSSQPSLVDGQWVIAWSVVQKTADELQAETNNQMQAVRSERNSKLAASDWTQLADSVVDKTVWATYRQALRDVPSQSGFPWDVTWPAQPKS